MSISLGVKENFPIVGNIQIQGGNLFFKFLGSLGQKGYGAAVYCRKKTL
jgi:hypothetical protein